MCGWARLWGSVSNKWTLKLGIPGKWFHQKGNGEEAAPGERPSLQFSSMPEKRKKDDYRDWHAK
jgi:hypothetical protein